MEDRELLETVVKRLVDKPSDVLVEAYDQEGDAHLLVRVAPEDRGKVIGRGGETVQSLRVLFGRIAASTGRKIFIHIDEEAAA
jgi:hypothetical protein